ncbi:MAG: hypothetical protein H6712_10195 [Myxococcales bacterium]|nr:hypothetical protein [Myxococcales bacterium]
MDGRLRRARVAPVGILLLLMGCAGGEPGGGFSGPGFTFGGPGGDAGDSNDATGSGGTGPDSGVSTGDGSGGVDDGPPPGCTPMPELCNGLDDDCDGVPDDDDPEGGAACNTGMPGECADGVMTCAGGTLECAPLSAGVAEVCNGLDDDCDGTPDNGDPGGGGACNTGMPGICSDGTNSCVGGVLSCVPDQVAGAEICNGQDDDCDGAIDDGNPGGGSACGTGQPGICAAGTNTCVSGMITCQANNAPVAEICGNGLDDDCDSTVDDGCGCPFGLCSVSGSPMVNGCDPCVSSVCAADPYCCSTAWDSACVNEVETVCGQADCVGSSCAHLVCSTGVALTSGCHSCVSTICLFDSYCCTTAWDSTCVNEVASYCGLTCP